MSAASVEHLADGTAVEVHARRLHDGAGICWDATCTGCHRITATGCTAPSEAVAVTEHTHIVNGCRR